MTFVIAAPDIMTAAATDLAIVDADLSHAHSAASRATVDLAPAAADEVSVGIAHLFSEHAHGFQALAGKASVFHDQFVQNLRTSAAAYGEIDHLHASLLQMVDHPLQLLQLGAHTAIPDTERPIAVDPNYVA